MALITRSGVIWQLRTFSKQIIFRRLIRRENQKKIVDISGVSNMPRNS